MCRSAARISDRDGVLGRGLNFPAPVVHGSLRYLVHLREHMMAYGLRDEVLVFTSSHDNNFAQRWRLTRA
jgi:hypothetical protein